MSVEELHGFGPKEFSWNIPQLLMDLSFSKDVNPQFEANLEPSLRRIELESLKYTLIIGL